ncbi:MAG TPA: HAD family hydrolase [Bacillota bacterium]|nr:HAD family hydrolase [Bacillota bacterium]
MKRTKAVIFDLDGTLLNTIGDITESVNAAMAEINEKPFSSDEVKYFVGSGVDILVNRIIKIRELDMDMFDYIKKAYLKYYSEYRTKTTAPYPGISDLLKNLSGLEIDINVLSNKPENDVIPVIAENFPEMDFKIVMGKRETFPIKPDPTSVLYLVKQLGIDRNKVLYVGDSEVDILTALNAGLESVGVLWGFRTETELRNAGAKHLVKSPGDIVKIIEKREKA